MGLGYCVNCSDINECKIEIGEGIGYVCGLANEGYIDIEYNFHGENVSERVMKAERDKFCEFKNLEELV